MQVVWCHVMAHESFEDEDCKNYESTICEHKLIEKRDQI